MIALLLALLATPALGQSLTLDDVLASVDRHPKLIAADAERARAQGAVLSADGAFDPTLNGFVGGRAIGPYEHLVAGASVGWQSPLWGAELDAGWKLGDGDFAPYEGKQKTLDSGELYAKLKVPVLKGGFLDEERIGRRVTRQEEVEAIAERDAMRLDLRAAGEAAWWDWAAAAQSRSIAEELLKLATEREAGLIRKVEQGAAAPIDALEYKRSVLKRRSKVAETQAKERVAASKLALYLRTAEGDPLLPAEGTAPALPDVPRGLIRDLDGALDAAWGFRPEGAQWRANANAADQTLRLARANVLPKLDVSVLGEADMPSTGDPVGTLEARVELQWPTLMRSERGKVLQAKAKAEEVNAKLRFARDTIEMQVVALSRRLVAAEERLALATEAVVVTDQLAEAERRRFDLGDSDLLFVNLREQTAAGAREEQALLRAQVLGLRAAWRALVGPDA